MVTCFVEEPAALVAVSTTVKLWNFGLPCHGPFQWYVCVAFWVAACGVLSPKFQSQEVMGQLMAVDLSVN